MHWAVIEFIVVLFFFALLKSLMVVLKQYQSQHLSKILMMLAFMHLLNVVLQVRPARPPMRLHLNYVLAYQNKADLVYLMNLKRFP